MDAIKSIKKLLMIQSLSEAVDKFADGDEEMSALFLEILKDAETHINANLDPISFMEALIKIGNDEDLLTGKDDQKDEKVLDKRH